MRLEIEALPGDVLGLSALSRRLLGDRPCSAAAPGLIVPARIGQIPLPERSDDDLCVDRVELVERLEGRVAGAPVGVVRSLEKLRAPNSLCVVCGQQPGLFGGPLLNLYKALHTCRLAEELERASGRPIVPVFWNHADDHDLSEVNNAYVINRHLDVARIALAGLGSGRQPFARIELDEERHRPGALLEHLRQLLPATEHRDAALELFAPRAGEALSAGFTRGFTQLLGHRGLLVVEPDDLRPGAVRALARIAPLDPAGAVACAEDRLVEQGVAAERQFDAHAWFFRVDADGRRPLRAAEDGFRYDGEPGSRSGVELAAELVAEPDGWSAGALLRPLVQDLCLPSVAYVGGHGELAYHALLPELRARAGLPEAVFVPRVSATLISPASSASAARSDLSVLDVLRARGAFAPDSGERLETPAVVQRLRAIVAEFTGALTAERAALAEIDRALSGRLRQSSGRAAALIERIADKAERSAANRTGKGRRHLRRLGNALFPRDAPQERRLTTLQYIAAFGRDWIDALADQLEPLPTEHLAVHLGEPAAERSNAAAPESPENPV